MGSTHPPLESLLNLSQNCLEGFELSRLNRISNLRKEFRQILAEWIEFEIEARFARWVLQYRHMCDPVADQADLPAFGPPQIPLRGVTHSSEQLLLPSGDEIPLEFPFVSLVEPRVSVAFELRLPLRHFPVSQNASAALRSLELFSSCEALAIGEQLIDLRVLDATDLSPSCPFLPFPQPRSAAENRNLAPPMSGVLAGNDKSAHSIVRCAPKSVTRDRAALGNTVAQLELCLLPPSRPSSSRLSGEDLFAPGRSHGDLCPVFAIPTFATSIFALSCRAFAS